MGPKSPSPSFPTSPLWKLALVVSQREDLQSLCPQKEGLRNISVYREPRPHVALYSIYSWNLAEMTKWDIKSPQVSEATSHVPEHQKGPPHASLDYVSTRSCVLGNQITEQTLKKA